MKLKKKINRKKGKKLESTSQTCSPGHEFEIIFKKLIEKNYEVQSPINLTLND